MAWNGGWQVKIGHTLAQTNGAPSMTVDTAGVVHLVYVGKHGTDIHISQNDGKDLAQWTGNEVIKDSNGKKLEAKEPPVIGYWPIGLIMHYIDHSGGLVYTFPLVPAGTGWAAPIPVAAFPGNWHEPIVLQAGFRFYLVALDRKGDPWYSFQSFNVNPGPNIGSISPFFGAKALPRTEPQLKEQAPG
jgi:hypothetical protein